MILCYYGIFTRSQIRTRYGWVGSANATCVLCHHPIIEGLFPVFKYSLLFVFGLVIGDQYSLIEIILSRAVI